MNDRKIIMMPGSVYNEHVAQQNIFPGLRQVENKFAAAETPPEEAMPAEEACEIPQETEKPSFRLLVTHPEKADEVIGKLHELIDGQSRPKSIVKPIRAAMDAGAITRPTWEQFCAEFGREKVNSSTSFHNYTSSVYQAWDTDFDEIVHTFQSIIR